VRRPGRGVSGGCWCYGGGGDRVVGEDSGRTRRAGVSVPSTSKRQIVFLTGRSSKGG